MKRLFVFASLFALLAVALPSQAQRLTGKSSFEGNSYSVIVDSLTFSRLGSPTRICTLAATAFDTTTNSYEIAGVSDLSITVVSHTNSDAATDLDFNVTAYVSADLNTWVPLATVFSTGQTSSPGNLVVRDTTQIVYLTNGGAGEDSVMTALGAANLVTATGADQRKVRSARWMRLVIDGDASAGDSSMVSAVAVRQWR